MKAFIKSAGDAVCIGSAYRQPVISQASGIKLNFYFSMSL